MGIRYIAAVVVLASVAFLVCAATVTGQVPQRMNYQVMLTDDSDQPLADQTVDVVFRIYAVSTGGPILWAESHSVTTNSIGVASVTLGTTNPLTMDFDIPLWLEVEVEGDILMPRRELVAVPYALHARTATYATNSGPSDSCLYAAYADTAGYALATAPVDTAQYALNAGHADTAGYALATPPCDTCAYAVSAGSAATAANADSLDHMAAASYALGADYVLATVLGDTGTINDSGNPVAWTKLKDVPAGFADGVDDTGGGGSSYSLDADDGDPTEAVYVDSVGNVGIGTTTPAYRVDVHSAGESIVGLYNHESAGGAIDLLSPDVKSEHTQLQPDVDGDAGFFYVDAPLSGSFIIDGNDEGDSSLAVYIDGEKSSIEFDVGESGDTSVDLPVGSVNSLEMLNEPGVACYYTGSGLGMTGLYQPVVSQTIVAPGPGYAFVIATGQANCTHDTLEVARLMFGVSPDSTILAEGLDQEIQLPVTLNAGAYKFAFAPAAVFPIDSAGPHTFYLTASASGTWYIYDTSISVIYFPTAYGSVSGETPPPTAAANDADAVTTWSNAESRRMESEAFDQARIERELAGMEARIAEIRAKMTNANDR